MDLHTSARPASVPALPPPPICMAILEALLSVLTPAQVVDALHEEADGGDTQGKGNRHRGDLVL